MALALVAACVVCFVPLFVRSDPHIERWWLSPQAVSYFIEADPVLFFGTIAGDIQSATFNLLYVVLLGLVVGLSMSWSFTEEWGEYFALIFWATAGMMLLTAAEELVTLVLDPRDDDDLPLPEHAARKSKRRSAEG